MVNESADTSPVSPDFGDTLIREAAKARLAIEARGLSQRQRASRTAEHIASLMDAYSREFIYLNGDDVQIPTEHGIGVGLSETTGSINGFGYGQYYTTQGNRQKGLLMFMGVSGMGIVDMDDRLAKDSSWRHNVLGSYDLTEFEEPGSELFIIGVPLKPGQRITRLDKPAPMPNTLAELDKAAETPPKAYDHMDYVRRIDAITGRTLITNAVIDKAKLIAIDNENVAMNNNCPYLGKAVAYISENFRFHHPEDSTRILFANGTVAGVLRKFIVAEYQYQGIWYFGPQAVLYPPDKAQDVYAGRLTPQEVDAKYASFVPLSLKHELILLDEN
jgi:hypothetical protein